MLTATRYSFRPVSACRADERASGVGSKLFAGCECRSITIGAILQDHWDSFGRLVQNTTSEVPIITAVGNHEFENRALPCMVSNSLHAYDMCTLRQDINALTHISRGGAGKTYDAWLYRWRHDEPNNGGDYWFSFDYGPVHFVFLTTEHDSRRQVDWLERDLGAADTPERRLRVPWIIVIAHHPMLNAGKYSMSGDNRDAFAPLFKRHRVTMYFCGHCHNYERTMPINADGITDTGAGTLQEPYIQEIHPASAVARVGSRLEAVPGYCNWSGCQDGRQGDPWCSGGQPAQLALNTDRCVAFALTR